MITSRCTHSVTRTQGTGTVRNFKDTCIAGPRTLGFMSNSRVIVNTRSRVELLCDLAVGDVLERWRPLDHADVLASSSGSGVETLIHTSSIRLQCLRKLTEHGISPASYPPGKAYKDAIPPKFSVVT